MERTPTEKLWMIGTGIVGFVLVLIGYFFFISPQRSRTGSVNDQIATAQTSNLGLQGKITALNAEYAKLTSYKEQLHVAQLALPTASGMPAFLRTLQSLGSQTSTSLTNLTVGSPTDLDGGQIVAPAPASSSSSPSPSSSTSTAPAAPAGLYAIPITATVSGSRPALSKFLTQLQSVQPRAVLITTVTLGATQPVATTTHTITGARTSMDLTMQAFVAPATTPVAPPAVGATPSPTPSSSAP
jgi:hypothetical protein